MKFIDKLERKYGKYGKYGIPDLTIYIMISYVLGYALMMVNPGILSMLSLDVSRILHGQIWRLVTWVIYPPSTQGPLWFIIAILLFYYPISKSLENTWGNFRFTLYVLSGIVFTVISAFLLYVISPVYASAASYYGAYSTYYISISIFLAYAFTYPEMRVYIYFVLPIKMKWMAVFYAVILVFNAFTYIRGGWWFMVFPIVASLLNFILFFLGTRNMSRYNPKEIHRRNEFKRAVAGSRVNPSTGGISKHKCAICGRTEKDDPNLEFRFCSRCNGNYEYCQDHLFTHTHVK